MHRVIEPIIGVVGKNIRSFEIPQFEERALNFLVVFPRWFINCAIRGTELLPSSQLRKVGWGHKRALLHLGHFFDSRLHGSCMPPAAKKAKQHAEH